VRVTDYKCFRTDALRSVIIISTEKVHSHFDFFLGLGLLDSGGSGTTGGSSSRGTSGGTGSGGLLEGLSLGEAIIGAERDSSQVFESAHYEVGDS